MRKIVLFGSILFLWTCGGGGGGSSPTEPEVPPIVINLTSLDGQAQKGPFNNGTAINIAELTNTLSPTGRNFSSAITDNTGQFAVANVQLESPYVELRANGYYFNEVSNEISSGQLTLFALSNLTGKTSLNVNIITHLEKNRMVTLMSGDSPKTFAQAKLQAQEEVFAVFDYSRANVPESELLDISQGGAANGKLLAMSAIIQGDLTVGQMSQLLANISTDIASDGTLDDTSLRATLINNSQNLDMAEVRSNLVAHYSSLGISATIPDFETEINQFLKPPVSQDISGSTSEDTAINITLAGSDPEGESLTYTILEVNNATVTLNGNVATYTPVTHFNGTDTFTYYANDGTSDSNVATVTMTVSAEDDEPNTIDVATTTDEDVAVTVNLSADEYDGDSYSFAIIADVSNGATSLNGSVVTYTPNQDWNGTDTFTFEATDDRTLRTNVATATITVNQVNDAPEVPTSFTATINEDTPIDIELSGTDVDGDDLTYSFLNLTNGSVEINGATATYTPNQDWNGTEICIYKANDGDLESNVSNVTITVSPVNDAPVSEDVTSGYILSGEEELINLSASDVDGDDLNYSIVSYPSNGSLKENQNSQNSAIYYTSNLGFDGVDTYTYKANDGILDSNIATATARVNAGGNIVMTGWNSHVSFTPDWSSYDGYQASEDPGKGIHSFAISIWVKFSTNEGTSTYSSEVTLWDETPTGNDDILRLQVKDTVTTATYKAGSITRVIEHSHDSIDDDNWHNFMFVREYNDTNGGDNEDDSDTSSTDNGLRLYVDGVFLGSRENPENYGGDFGLMRLGLDFDEQQNFLGKMDGFAIWDDVLTQEEITQIYQDGRTQSLSNNNGNYTSSSDLVLFYDFTGDQNHLGDNTGNSSQDGTLNIWPSTIYWQ